MFEYCFVDMDLKDGIYASKDDFYVVLNQFPLKPTLVVDSGNGVHAYWAIKDLDRESYIITQLALIQHFKTDDSIWTVLQLMRVPGLFNTKDYDNLKKATILDFISSGNEYVLADFPKELYDNLSDEAVRKAENHLAKLDGKLEIKIAQDVNLDELPESFLDLMYENQQVSDLFNNPLQYRGDRSSADMKLSNILYNKNIKKNDALAVLSNTQKALSKGTYRFEYAIGTVDKAYVDRAEHKFLNVAQQIARGVQDNVGELVKGPIIFDCLTKGWAKKQVMGIIAGPSIGKTCVTLKIMRDMIYNNPDKDDIYIFVSLEMPEADIIDRWIDLVGKDTHLANRLYVIANEDSLGEPRNIGIQQLFEYSMEIKKQTGKEIGCVAIDHIGILNKVVDMSKKYTFGVENEQKQYGDKRCSSMENLCTQMKVLAKMLNTFLIVLTQTTKGKGTGDVPIAADGAYGTSFYENVMDYVVTLWQPLLRIQSLTDYYFLSWAYMKVREKRRTDPVKVTQPNLLRYEPDTGDIVPPTLAEEQIFYDLLPKALQAREDMEKKRVNNYTITASIEELKKILEKIRPNKQKLN